MAISNTPPRLPLWGAPQARLSHCQAAEGCFGWLSSHAVPCRLCHGEIRHASQSNRSQLARVYSSRYQAFLVSVLIMQMVYSRVQGRICRLRPCSEAPLYDTLQLQPGDTLHLLSWTLENGFARVGVSPTHPGHPDLWIRPKYLRIPGPRPGLLWVEFTTSDWEGRSWTFHPKNFVAWVSRSDGLAQLDPRERAQLEHYLAISR